LIADANVRSAEGAVTAANASPNPVFTGSVGNAVTYADTNFSRTNCLQNGSSCTPWILSMGITDSGALSDFLSGTKGLRARVALNALASAKMSRVDAERNLGFAVKSAYSNVVQAVLSLKFAREVAATNVITLQKFQTRFKLGLVNEADLQRIETQKLESDQAVEAAVLQAKTARVGLAFLLGVRGATPDFGVDESSLNFSVPTQLESATEKSLTTLAYAHRPDLLAAGYAMDQANAQIDLNERMRFPQIALGVNYAWGGFGGFSTNGPVGPQTLSFSISVPLPVFYQLDGEIAQAHAQFDAGALARAKVTAQIASDVSIGLANFASARRIVERMEGPRRADGGLLESATGAFHLTALLYDKGAASLTDYLDALRGFISTKVEEIGDLANYWTAVYQLEQAVGVSLR
jgi:cobalt-zinc-cadmium efflux system outer membrane protein